MKAFHDPGTADIKILLIGSRSIITGHHAPLYSTVEQRASVDNAVQYLDSLGVPLRKIAVGAAFYGRKFVDVPDIM